MYRFDQNLFDDLDVPEERDIEVGTTRKNVSSPKTKTSKLCFDKGYMKLGDKEKFLHACKFQSSVNVLFGVENRAENFAGSVKTREALRKHATDVKLKNYRKRLQSLDNEFKLVPLLRKVSYEPDPT